MKKLLLMLCVTSAVVTAEATVRVAKMFTDNMVLQRETPVTIWGWADEGEKVVVTLGDVSRETVAAQDGYWSVAFPAQPAVESTTMTVQGANTLTFTNVALGDVWFTSGQSNMEWQLANSSDSAEEIANADFPKIRFYREHHMLSGTPQRDLLNGRQWVPVTPQTAGGMSGVAFYFARDIQPRAGVVIGIVEASWGGSNIESFLSHEGVAKTPELADDRKRYDEAVMHFVANIERWGAEVRAAIEKGDRIPGIAGGPTADPMTDGASLYSKYNPMIAPWTQYAVRGILWYQGCSNGGEGDSYKYKMKALVNGWREAWGVPDLPFYWVQLANFMGDNNAPAGGDGYAKIRMAQFEALGEAPPPVGMALAIDIGDTNDIHPRNKYDVGIRLARWARRDVYGETGLVPSGPLYTGMAIEDGAIRIAFDYASHGLMIGKKDGRAPTAEDTDGTLMRFAIAGEDKRWVWANARIDGDTVVVSSPDVPQPVAVRYAFSTNPLGANLYNKDGLPASPFRTDKW